MIIFYIISAFAILIIILFLFAFCLNQISKKKHKGFKKEIEGKNIFITTNKIEFSDINKYVIENLSDVVHIELISGKVKSIYNADKIHRLIGRENFRKFPIAMKTINGEILFKSFYNDYKNALKDKSQYLNLPEKIRQWYF